MSNHVHLVAIPHKPDSLANAFKLLHGRYASYWNVAHAKSGHAWQGRFYSCPMDAAYLWEALRYTELNPVRAGMVEIAESWMWSSAAAHCGTAEPDTCLSMESWRKVWSCKSWKEFLSVGQTNSQLAAIRQCTHTGRPLGSAEFIEQLERATSRQLAPRKGGRPAKTKINSNQGSIIFDP
jgi:putative transposase